MVSRWVGAEFGCAVEDAHALLVGDDAEGAPYMRVRHRVVVQIEAHIRRLADVHRQTLAERELALGPWQQAGALSLERIMHAEPAVFGPAPVRGLARSPSPRLRVQVGQVGELARGEEGVAHVADRALDPPLLVATRHRHRARLVAVMGRERQQFGVEADRVALALEDGALEVVVEQDAGHTERSKPFDVTAQEAVHAGVEEEAKEDGPRVAQHHHEGHQGPARAADLQVAEVSPVDLRLFAWQRAQAQEGLGRGPRPYAGDDVAEVLGAAAVAALMHHDEQSRGRERGELGQRLEDEGPVPVNAARSQRHHRRRHARLREHAPHGVAMHMQLPGNGADAPMLGLVQTQDLGVQLEGDDQRGLLHGLGSTTRAGQRDTSP